jgi:hypothetical protein
MSVTATRSVTITAPFDEVLAVVRDVGGQQTWWPGMVASEVLETDEVGQAVRARIVNDVKVVKDEFEVVYEHPAEGLTWQLAGSSMAQRSQEGSLLLATEGDGEATTATLTLTVATTLPLPKLLQRKVVTDSVTGALAGLKRHCEG